MLCVLDDIIATRKTDVVLRGMATHVHNASVRLSVDRSETGNKGRPATAHDHPSGRRRSVHLPDKDMKEKSRQSSRHLRYVGVREKTRVSAAARVKQERDIGESQRRQRFDM